MFAVSEVQSRVEICGKVPKVTLVGDRVHVRPDGVETETVSAIVPVKPLTAFTVIVEVPEDPARTCVGEAAPGTIVKSWIVKVAVAEWVSPPLVPVKVRSYVAGAFEVQDTVAVPDPDTLVGVIGPHVNPAGTRSDNVTKFANPFDATTVIVEIVGEPASTAAGDVALIVKSGGGLKVKVALVE